MENEKKMTKRDYYEEILSILTETDLTDETSALVDFVKNQIDTLDKRAEKAKERAAEKKAEGDELRETVKNVLTNDFQTVEDIVNALDNEEITKAKVIARLTQLVTLGEVEKTDVKDETSGKTRKAYKLV
jgi:G:T/U-mismatch repair DNA glycosylase